MEIDLEPYRSAKGSSGYRGVSRHRRDLKYNAQIKVNGVLRHLGYFDTAEEAAQVYARAHLREHGGPPAPPAPSVADQLRQEGEEEIDLEPFRSEKGCTGYRGVYWDTKKVKYQAQISVNGANQYLGYFDTVKEAAQAYARAYLSEHGGPLAAMPLQEVPSVEAEEVENEITTKISAPGAAGGTADAPQPQRMPRASLMAVSSSEQGGLSSQEPGEEEIDLEPVRSPHSSAGYRAVYWHVYWMSSMQKYNAKIKVNGVNRSLGLFDTAEQAARAYARAYLREHGGPSALSLADHVRQEEEGEEEIDLEPFRTETSNAGYRGVHWDSSRRKYRSKIRVNGAVRYLGLFVSAKEAAQVYARAHLREHGGPSCPSAPTVADQFRQEEEGEEEIDLEPFRSETSSTGYRGVSWDAKNLKYQAKISVNRAQRYLGSFDTAEEAAQSYARAYISEYGGPPASTRRPAPPGSRKMGLPKSQASSENDDDDEEEASLRPAKRARVATAEESG
jgi:hypothetical protein